MIFNLDENIVKATLENWQKVIFLVGTFETLSRPLWVNLSLFSTDKDYISKLYLAQFETHQLSLPSGQNMCKV